MLGKYELDVNVVPKKNQKQTTNQSHKNFQGTSVGNCLSNKMHRLTLSVHVKMSLEVIHRAHFHRATSHEKNSLCKMTPLGNY